MLIVFLKKIVILNCLVCFLHFLHSFFKLIDENCLKISTSEKVLKIKYSVVNIKKYKTNAKSINVKIIDKENVTKQIVKLNFE